MSNNLVYMCVWAVSFYIHKSFIKNHKQGEEAERREEVRHNSNIHGLRGKECVCLGMLWRFNL